MTIATGTLIKGVGPDGSEQFIRVSEDGSFEIETGDTILEPLVFAHKGSQQLTIDGTARSLTVPAGATHAFMSFSGTAGEFIRMKLGGVNPTGTVGTKVIVGDYIDMTDPLANYASLLSGFRGIRGSTNTADVIADIEYFGAP